MIRVPVTLTEEVRRLYDQIEEISANRFERILNSSNSTIVPRRFSFLIRTTLTLGSVPVQCSQHAD